MEQFKTNTPTQDASPTRYASPALSGTNPISVLDLARILRRRAPLALLTFAVTVAVALFVTSRMTKTYEATTKLLLDNSAASAIPTSVIDLVMGGGKGASGEVEIEKIKSRAFMSEVIRKAELGPDASPEDMKNRVEVTLSGSDKIMAITATIKKDPVMAARVANTVAEVYKQYVTQEGDRKIERSSLRLRQAAAKAEREKDAANRAMQAFMARRGVSDPKSFYLKQSEKTVTTMNALKDAERDLASKRNDIVLFARQVNTTPPTVITGTSLNPKGQIASYEDQIVNLRNERSTRRQDYGEQSPEIIEIDNKIAAARASIRSLKSDPMRTGSVGVGRNSDYSAAVSNYRGAQLQLKQAEVTIAALRTQLRELQAEQFELAPERVQFQDLQLRVDVTFDAYAKAKSALLQIPINRPLNLPSIEVLEPARVPNDPVSPKPLLNLILALFSGLFLGVIAAILAEYFTAAPKPSETGDFTEPLLPRLPAAPVFAENLPGIAGVPLLARVPLSGGRALPSNAGTGLPATGTDAATEDAFREIGYLLSHHAEIGAAETPFPTATRVPVVLMAGTRSDETTASVAAYLTATLVRDGVRVTLVDGDRTDPRLHQVFGKPDAPGVTDILAGRVTAGDALHIGAGGTLRFLAAGAKSDPTPLTEDALRDLYDELGRPADTDLVLISGPSVWSARVVSPMERAADGVVLVASDAQVAPEESVARARRILTNGYQPRLLGVIVGEETTKEPSVIVASARSETNRGDRQHEN